MSLIDYPLSYIFTYCDQHLSDQIYHSTHPDTPPLSPSHSDLTTPSNTTFDSKSVNLLPSSSPPLPPPTISLPLIPTQHSRSQSNMSTSSIQPQLQFNLKPNSSLQAAALLNTLNRRPTNQTHQRTHSDHHLNSISSPTLLNKSDECHFAFINQTSSTPISSTPPPTTFVQSTDFLSGSPAPSSTSNHTSLLQSLSPDLDKKPPHSSLRQITNFDPITQSNPNSLCNHVSPKLSPISPILSPRSNHPIQTINPQSDKLIPMSSPSISNQIDPKLHKLETINPDQNQLSTINQSFVNPASSTLSPRNTEPIQTSSQLPHDQVQSQSQILTPSSTLPAQTPGSGTGADPITRPITTSYMAINFLNDIKPNQSNEPIENPTHIINQNMITSSHSPQSITISISSANHESLYRANSKIIPITLFPSLFKFSNGKKVAVDGFISYATKVGRIRVIDQISGARMLLRKHEGIVIDMSIGKPNEGKRWRCIGSIGTDRRLVIWKVPNRFEEESANYEVLVDLVIQDESIKFMNLKWHPKDPSVLLVSTNDKRLILIRLDRAGFLGMWKRGIGIGRSISEVEGFEGQDIVQTNSNVVGFCFSPDGSAFAYVTEDGLITVRETLKPHWTIMGGQLSGTKPITKIEFITTSKTNKPIGFLIGRDEGRLLEIVSLISISKPMISIEFLVPDGTLVSECFGDSNWLNRDQTILVSNSLRGSIYGFKLKVKEEEMDESQQMNHELNKSQTQTHHHHHSGKIEDDSIYIEGRRNKQTEEKIFVERIGEISTPDPIISFVIDEGSMTNQTNSSGEISTFNIHPKGIHQLFLPKDLLQAEVEEKKIKTKTEEGEETEEGMYRRKSLAGEILHHRGSSTRTGPGKTRQHSGFRDELLVSNKSIDESCLKRLEESLIERMSKMFTSQVNQLEKRFEKEKIEDKILENERQSEVIRMISNSLEINTKKVLKELIKKEIEEKVLPEILNVVQQTIKKEIHQLISSPSPSTSLRPIQIPNLPAPSSNPSSNPTTIIPSSYEDLFLSALSNESNLTIHELINLYSLEKVFEVGLSQAVLLTLSHHLSESLKTKDDRQTGMYVGRVLDLVCDGLLEFKRFIDQSNHHHHHHHHHQGNVSIGIDEVLKLVIEKKNRLIAIQN
ncbi:hypothetical protein DFH28DRAFT_1156954 [Melampsora americana]|nr:hypothetical protein DFH28DRAFT_1156954 [Melampsora americana]